MSTIQSIAATYAYRRKVSLAAANGTAISKIAFLAFGSGDKPYSLDDTRLDKEFKRVDATVSVQGVELLATGSLKGLDVGSRTLCEVGVFTADGVLVGRRVLAPKQFEPETEMDFELTFQY